MEKYRQKTSENDRLKSEELEKQRNQALRTIRDQVMQEFETPSVPPFSRPGDLSLVKHACYAGSFGLHIWLDPQQRMTMARYIIWETVFDIERLWKPALGLKYGTQETPTLITQDYAPPYDELEYYIAAVLGHVPADPRRPKDHEDDWWKTLVLRLPLGELSMRWGSHEKQWQTLTHHCQELHDWLLTTPKL